MGDDARADDYLLYDRPHTDLPGVRATQTARVPADTPAPGIFLHDWRTIEDVQRDFWPGHIDACVYAGELEDVIVVLASYSCAYYDGQAFVLFVRDGILYEVNASHCSCMGLEGQWAPEPTSIAALRFRLKKGTLGAGDSEGNGAFSSELHMVLEKLEREA